MSSSPYQSPVSDPVAPDAEVETITGSKGWMLKFGAIRLLIMGASMFVGIGASMVVVARIMGPRERIAQIWAEVLAKHGHEYVYGYGLLLLFLLLLLLLPPLLTVSRSFRRTESRMRRQLVSPGDTPVRQLGLASLGLPLLGGALVLTGGELIFYHRPWARYLENLRIPLADIAAVQAEKGIRVPGLMLTLSSGRILKFRVLDGERWREAIGKLLDQA